MKRGFAVKKNEAWMILTFPKLLYFMLFKANYIKERKGFRFAPRLFFLVKCMTIIKNFLLLILLAIIYLRWYNKVTSLNH